MAVGGSEYALNKKDFRGLAAVSSRGSVNISWWNGEEGMGGPGEIKSNRKASMIKTTARLCVAGMVHVLSGHAVESGSERRVSRKPLVKR